MNSLGAFIITKDHINDEEDKRVGMHTRDYTASLPSLPFKIYDDDGILYYEGRAIVEDDFVEGEENFRPLDWASSDAGCTYIKYRNKETGKWEVL